MPSRQRKLRNSEAQHCSRRRVCLPLSLSDVRRMFLSMSQRPDCASESIIAKASSPGPAASLESLAAIPIDTNTETLDSCEAPMSPAPSCTTVGETIDDDQFFPSESFLPAVAVPLRPSVFFFYAPSTPEDDEDYGGPPLLRAQSVEAEFLGMLRVVAEDASNQTIYASMSELLIDARVHSEDDARLSNFIGARVNKGKIESLHLDAYNRIYCDVRRRCALKGEEAILQIPIEQAVEEIRSLEKQRQNANLETYQRQICSSMMRAQRARYLGLPTQSCPF